MKKEQILSLDAIDKEKLIIGIGKSGDERIFIVNHVSSQDDHTSLELIEINEHFTKWSGTFYTECTKEKTFVSICNKDWEFSFFETQFTIKEISDMVLSSLYV